MKRFFKKIFIIALGTILGGVITVGIALGVVLLIEQQRSNISSKLTPKTILRISLHGQLVEEMPVPFLDILGKSRAHEIDLLAVKKAIQMAQADDRIAGIYLELGQILSGWANLAELRNSLEAFKKSGKFIVAYGETYTSKTYYLASLADDIVLHPAGSFVFMGLNMSVLFYKGLFDKLEITPQIFRVGRYKSAVEPFMKYGMSEASKEQNQVLLNSIYDHLIETLAVARNIPPYALKQMANDLSVTGPQEATKAQLVTCLGYLNDVEALLKNKLNLEPNAKIAYIDFDVYQNKHARSNPTKEKIAVLVATGTIVDEEIGPNHITAKSFIKNLKELRENPHVKAIVIRINSPGGSALASDTMWKEIMITRAHKPVVASMSDVAASGGYYLAAACNYILAHPGTITGSIGIFGLYFDVHALLKNKLGIHGDVVKTAPSADMFSPTRSLTPDEKRIIQRHIEQGYENFLDRVATGRQMQKTEIARIAEGRVWSGSLAKEHKLVDELGGLEDAIKKAALLANLDESYQVDYWPKHRTNWLRDLIIRWFDKENYQVLESYAVQPYYVMLKSIQDLANRQGVQAWLPYTIQIE
ncbi:MAG: signal peptide peptidase SppA [Candidatus Amoebophilus sp. 36-38]|nr:MAG: signal peptide peptidase SppA [Candidatus Amoebophilus sp. 36-38]